MGWKSWEAPCKQLGILFAGAYEAGNNCPGKRRIRIVLDVLDEVRRNWPFLRDRRIDAYGPLTNRWIG